MPFTSAAFNIKSLFFTALLVVLVLSLVPLNALVQIEFNLWDKAQHALGFMALTALGLWAFPTSTQRVVFGLIAFGLLIEALQALVGWRQAEALDWFADILGIALVAGVVWWVRQRACTHSRGCPTD